MHDDQWDVPKRGIRDVLRELWQAYASSIVTAGNLPKENIDMRQKRIDLAKSFINGLMTGDEALLRSILTDDVVWTLPGESLVSGEFKGVEGILKRGQIIADHETNLKVLHFLTGWDDVAFILNNTGSYKGVVLNEFLTTVCRVRDGKIYRLETLIDDVDMVNAYFTGKA